MFADDEFGKNICDFKKCSWMMNLEKIFTTLIKMFVPLKKCSWTMNLEKIFMNFKKYSWILEKYSWILEKYSRL